MAAQRVLSGDIGQIVLSFGAATWCYQLPGGWAKKLTYYCWPFKPQTNQWQIRLDSVVSGRQSKIHQLSGRILKYLAEFVLKRVLIRHSYDFVWEGIRLNESRYRSKLTSKLNLIEWKLKF